MRIKNWDIFAFIAGYHLLLFALLPAFIGVFTWKAIVLCVITWAISGFSITAGYHRLFSHKTYKASPFYEWVALLSSSLAIQASALQWSNDHRIHHSHVDTDKDPYCIKKGFFYAHVGWLFTYKVPIDERLVSDLMNNPRVMFQHKYYGWVTLAVNLLVFGVGCLFMHPLASFVGGVLLRVFAIHHCTWFINSLAHVWGSRTYAKEQTAADNAIIALLTFGEGYHNFHHAIAHDYRNGIRWYHFDPSKWLIWTCSKLGLVKDLKWVSNIRLQQTLVNKDKEMILDHISREFDEKATEIRNKINELSELYHEKSQTLAKKLREMKVATAERRKQLEHDIKELKQELGELWKSWGDLTKFAAVQYSIAH
ncbi:fatty acid desaturase [Puniceicoccaceae bacterium K14]|nr:fatty acid desaturase [Puniceicoccaceae bacterium K14]